MNNIRDRKEDIINNILTEVLEKIRPSGEERKRLRKIFEYIKNRVTACLKNYVNEECFEVSLQGSVAKDTFLSGEADIDIFVIFNPTCTLDPSQILTNFVTWLRTCLKDLPNYTEYAEHPYLIINVKGLDINVVPSFRPLVRNNEVKFLTSVDRTPLHTNYILNKLSAEQRDEVRLLKSFLKALGIYGAEIRIRGFSGYLTELLIAYYGSFINVLKSSRQWRPFKTCIDLEGHYSNEEECLKVFEKSPLIVVDPVDSKRNAAAALSLRSLSIFVLASNLFLHKPSREFFHIYRKGEKLEGYLADEEFRKRGSTFIAVIVGLCEKTSPETIWGQLRRIEKVISQILKERRYAVLYHDSWSDERKIAIIAFELAHLLADCYEVFRGPSALDFENSVRFIEKNLGRILAGPWIDENGYLHVIRKRKRCLEHEFAEVIIPTIENILSIGSVRAVVHTLAEAEKHVAEISGKDVLESFRQWVKDFTYRNLVLDIYTASSDPDTNV